MEPNRQRLELIIKVSYEPVVYGAEKLIDLKFGPYWGLNPGLTCGQNPYVKSALAGVKSLC